MIEEVTSITDQAQKLSPKMRDKFLKEFRNTDIMPSFQDFNHILDEIVNKLDSAATEKQVWETFDTYSV